MLLPAAQVSPCASEFPISRDRGLTSHLSLRFKLTAIASYSVHSVSALPTLILMPIYMFPFLTYAIAPFVGYNASRTCSPTDHLVSYGVCLAIRGASLSGSSGWQSFQSIYDMVSRITMLTGRSLLSELIASINSSVSVRYSPSLLRFRIY